MKHSGEAMERGIAREDGSRLLDDGTELFGIEVGSNIGSALFMAGKLRREVRLFSRWAEKRNRK